MVRDGRRVLDRGKEVQEARYRELVRTRKSGLAKRFGLLFATAFVLAALVLLAAGLW